MHPQCIVVLVSEAVLPLDCTRFKLASITGGEWICPKFLSIYFVNSDYGVQLVLYLGSNDLAFSAAMISA